MLVCAAGNSTCYNQNPDFKPIPTNTYWPVTIKAWFGGVDHFNVWVGLTPDPEFLRDQELIDFNPLELRAERTVYWLGPVPVQRVQ